MNIAFGATRHEGSAVACALFQAPADNDCAGEAFANLRTRIRKRRTMTKLDEAAGNRQAVQPLIAGIDIHPMLVAVSGSDASDRVGRRLDTTNGFRCDFGRLQLYGTGE